jgi:MFS-type transporter involved in bile tolerance (Atg22 family)
MDGPVHGRFTRIAWILLDWAASSFSTVLITLVVAAVVAAIVGFDIAQVFTGSLLRRVAGERDADRLSAFGFAAGYAGGAIALVIATAVVAASPDAAMSTPPSGVAQLAPCGRQSSGGVRDLGGTGRPGGLRRMGSCRTGRDLVARVSGR